MFVQAYYFLQDIYDSPCLFSIYSQESGVSNMNLNNLRSYLLDLPGFDGDEEKLRRAQLINVVMLVTTLYLILVFFSNLVDSHFRVSTMIVEIGCLLSILLLKHLLHKGYLDLVGFLFIFASFVFTTFACIAIGTVRAPVTASFMLTVILAGLLFGGRGITLSTVSSSLLVMGLIFAENAGWMPKPNFKTTLTQWVTYTGLFGISGLVTYYAVQSMNGAMQLMRQELSVRKRLETQFRKFHVAVEQSPISVLMTDPDGTVEYVNQNFVTVTGYKGDDVIGKSSEVLWADVIPPEEYKNMWGMLISGTEWRGEFINRRKSGEPYVDSAIIRPVINEEGEIINFLSIQEDITERKQYEVRLRASEARFRALFEQSLGGVVIMGLDQMILFANKRFLEMIGYSHEELCQMKGRDLFAKNNKSEHSFERLLQGEKIPLIERYLTGKSGNVFPVDLYIELVSDSTGVPLHVQCIVRDISERKAAEEALRESESRYRLLAEHAQDVIWTLSLDGKFTYVSPSVLQQRGYTPEEVLQRTLEDAVCPASLPEVKAALRMALEQAKTRRLTRLRYIEIEQPCKDGSTIWTEATAQIFTDETGTPIGLVGVSRDITARKHAEEASLRNQARYRALFGQTHDAVFILGLDARHIDANQRAADMLGYTLDEIKKISVYETSAETGKSENVLKRLIAGETIPLYERLFRKKNGEIFPVEINLELVKDIDGTPMYIQSVVRDISDRKASEEALRVANKQLHAQVIEVERLQEELREQALHDPLTGLYNRRYLSTALDHEVKRARREKHPVSVIAMDIDHFKQVNDAYGHHTGDLFLKEVANLIKSHLRDYDFICRFGGEEFLMILPGMNIERTAIRAETIRKDCESLRVPYMDRQLGVTISLGVAEYNELDIDVEKVIVRADHALYYSKRNGRNRVTIWTPGINMEVPVF